MAACFRRKLSALCTVGLLMCFFVVCILQFRLQSIPNEPYPSEVISADKRLRKVFSKSTSISTDTMRVLNYNSFNWSQQASVYVSKTPVQSHHYSEEISSIDPLDHILKISTFIDGMSNKVAMSGSVHKLLESVFSAAKDLRAKAVFDFLACSRKYMEEDGHASPDYYNFTDLYSSFKFECTAFGDMHFMKSLVLQRKPPWPITALASFPGSGNTWLRYLLEQVTGVFTGSYDCDLVLKLAGLMGEGITSNNVLVIKTHRPSYYVVDSEMDGGAMFKAAIVLLRNPYDAIVAEYHRQVLWSHIRTLEPDHFKENFTHWNHTCFKLNEEWVKFVQFWLNDDVSVARMVVTFESLLANRTTVLKRVLKFLRLPVEEQKIDCVSRLVSSNVKRKYPGDRKYYPYTREQVVLIHQSILSLQPMLAKFGVDYSSWVELGDSLISDPLVRAGS